MTPETCPNPIADLEPVVSSPDPVANLRLHRVNRDDIIPIPLRLEDLLSPDHLARLVWNLVTQLDLSAFSEGIAVRVDTPGRPATDPLILIALWVYALSQGVTEARKLGRMCVD